MWPRGKAQDFGFCDRWFESSHLNQITFEGGDRLDVKLLKSKMVLYGDEEFVTAISKLLVISRQTASAKLNGASDFTQSEIKQISQHYHLSADDIKNIFVGDDESKRCSQTIG